MGNNHSMSRVERSRREKVTRYSIRKVSFGAASVAVAAFLMFLGNGAVYAAETNVTATDSALTATKANNQVDENPDASDSTAPKTQADATTSKPADATPAPVVSSPTPAPEEKSTEKNTEASSTEANSVENKEKTTVKAEEPSTTSAETTKPAEETATTESNKPKSRRKRALDANDQNRSGDAATTDGDDDSVVNEKDLHVVNPYFEDNGKPTTAEKWKVINAFDLIGWKPINPNQKKSSYCKW
ncbi:YSIRK-type signal peptide-containing protein [Streptococcus agalactiae]|nr:YSIRK-type signal peptide-containing protein [Streptococcus agalactiae]